MVCSCPRGENHWLLLVLTHVKYLITAHGLYILLENYVKVEKKETRKRTCHVAKVKPSFYEHPTNMFYRMLQD